MIRSLIVHATGLALNYGLTLMVVYAFSPAEAGAVFWYLHLLFALSLLTVWGADSWMVSALAASEPNGLGQSGGPFVRGLSLLGAINALLVLPVWAYIVLWDGQSPWFALAFTCALWGHGLASLAAFATEGAGQAPQAMFFRAIAPYLLCAPVLVALALAGVSLRRPMVFWLIGASCLACALAFLVPRLGPFVSGWRRPRVSEIGADLKRCLPNFKASILGFLFAWHTIFLAKAWLSLEDLGKLSYVLRVASLVSIPMLVIGISFARALARAQTAAELKAQYRRSIYLSVAASLPLFLLVAVLGGALTARLKPEYQVSTELMVVACGQFLSMWGGAQATVLAMRGGIEALNRNTLWALLASAAAVVPLAIQFGLAGVAVAVLVSLVLKLGLNARSVHGILARTA